VVGKDSIKIEYEKTDDPRSYRISSEKIRKELGFVPRHTIEEACQDLKDAFLAGKIPHPFEEKRYYNIKTMQALHIT
jgi:hypothetical protein